MNYGFILRFYSRSGKSVAHCMTHDDGTIGALYVDPQYRGQGFAHLVMSGIVDKHADQLGIRPRCEVVYGNDASLQLVIKLGFVDSGVTTVWASLSQSRETGDVPMKDS